MLKTQNFAIDYVLTDHPVTDIVQKINIYDRGQFDTGSDHTVIVVELNISTTTFSHEPPKQVGWLNEKKSLGEFHAELAKILRISLLDKKLLSLEVLAEVMRDIAKRPPTIKSLLEGKSVSTPKCFSKN